MREILREWYGELKKSPEDWSIRLRLIEAAVEDEMFEEAKRLVRMAPDESPLPEELRARIFELLSRQDVPPDIARLPKAKDP